MPLYTDFVSTNTTVTDADAINVSIKNILLTDIGSLPGKPTFGSDLPKTVFSQLDHITIDVLKDQIETALSIWEKRILVSDIVIKSIPEFNKLAVNITYTYRAKGLNVISSTTVPL